VKEGLKQVFSAAGDIASPPLETESSKNPLPVDAPTRIGLCTAQCVSPPPMRPPAKSS
jgi:hypothetical protein